MGICASSNDKNQEMLNNSTGPGLPPKEIIPQPVEVTNPPNDLNTQLTTPVPDNIETIQNQPINSVVQKVAPPIDQSINASNPNINSLNQPNENLELGQTIEQTQPIDNQIISNQQMVGVSQNGMILNSQLLGSTTQSFKQRLYIVVQMPGREIEITKLYDNNTLIDIEPFIVPDSIDEFDFCDSRGYLINDLMYIPFKDWHDVRRTLRIKLIRAGLYIPNDIRSYIAKRT